MPRAPSNPLAGIDHEGLGLLTQRLVREHARRLGTSADGDTVASDVRELVTYARDGSGLTADAARATLAAVVPALYGCAADADDPPGPDHLARLRGGAAATGLDLALHLAWARWRIASGQPVPASALVALGGYALGTGTANRLVRAGEIDARRVGGDWEVTAAAARKWLAKRG